MVTIDCVADLHGHYPQLEGGDLLIVAGDLTKSDTETEYIKFISWCFDNYLTGKFSKIIWIAGNHDNWVQENVSINQQLGGSEYLCDSGTEFEYEEPVRDLFDPGNKSLVFRKKLKIWGSPWTKRFPGMNPHCMAFTVDTDEELAEKWALIPEDTDILVTHCPPYGIMDRVNEVTKWGTKRFNVGSPSLLNTSRRLKNLKLFVFGHIHESYGQISPSRLRMSAAVATREVTCASMPHIANASHVNERYEPVNKPIRIEL